MDTLRAEKVTRLTGPQTSNLLDVPTVCRGRLQARIVAGITVPCAGSRSASDFRHAVAVGHAVPDILRPGIVQGGVNYRTAPVPLQVVRQ